MPSLPSSSSEVFDSLDKRRYCNGFSGFGCGGNSAWYVWGRYVVLAGVIVLALIIFLSFACITARRRRARGAQPYYGTGWMSRNHGPVNYYGGNPNQPEPYGGQQQQYNSWNAAPPSYGAPGTYGARQETGVELQPPAATYNSQQGGNYVYSPPSGPPPGKSDVVR